MTKLEFAALALAAEVEAFLKYNSATTGLSLSLNEFRKAQVQSDIELGVDLEAMHAQHIERSCPVINIYDAKKSKK